MARFTIFFRITCIILFSFMLIGKVNAQQKGRNPFAGSYTGKILGDGPGFLEFHVADDVTVTLDGGILDEDEYEDGIGTCSVDGVISVTAKDILNEQPFTAYFTGKLENINGSVYGSGSIAEPQNRPNLAWTANITNSAIVTTAIDTKTSIVPTVLARINPRTGRPYRLVRSISFSVMSFHAYYRDTGNPITEAPVQITLQGEDGSGGHNHSPGDRRHGWILTLDDFAAEPKFPPDNKNSGAYDTDAHGSILNGVTDKNGDIYFVYIAPEFSGTEKIEALLIQGDYPKVSLPIDVKTPDLIDLSQFTDFPWQPYGQTDAHPSSHWITADTVDQIRTAANLYKEKQEQDVVLRQTIAALTDLGYDFADNTPSTPEPLYINDISLEWGGMFDIGEGDFWLPPHGGHRNGNQADFRSTHLVSGDPLKATAANAVGDTRLEAGRPPFNKLPAKTRAMMDNLVKRIHLRRIVALRESLRDAGAVFYPEGNHFHAAFGQ